MIDDTIKLLSLEHLETLIVTLDVIHTGDKIECQIQLKRQAMTCPYCGGSDLHIHSYKTKKIIHSVNTRTATQLIIRYRIQRCTHCKRTIENINSQIKTIMKSANGYKEFERLRRRIFYTLNRDTLIKW